jgi:hypothetical protein
MQITDNSYDDLVKGLGGLIRSPQALMFEGDCCALQISDVLINMQRDPEKNLLVLSTYLGELPKLPDPQFLEQLLIANLYWQAGATICLEPNHRALIMLHAEPMPGLTAPRLLDRLNAFALNAKERRGQCARYLQHRR